MSHERREPVLDLQAAQDWLLIDPDPQTRRELQRLIAHAQVGNVDAERELIEAFDGTLEFGTAGLRGALGPGSNRMNRVVVIRAAAGLARYLNRTRPDGSAIVIGYDARHNSDVFAHETAAIMTGAGIEAMVLPRALPTPVLAFAIRHLGCAAGVMVTASHNPPRDNGYKVYLGDGSQIVSPIDAQISACIADITTESDIASLPRGEEWLTLGDEVLDAYVARTSRLLPAGSPREVTVAYTPLHGVGGSVFERVLQEAGFAPPIAVSEQFMPDPNFPTVAFPNPEEPGAMDLAIATAERSGADLVIANDPDADRCAVAVPTPDGWRRLKGDEVGALLAWWLIEQSAPKGIFAQSIVSCSLLEAIARAGGHDYQQTLTGFKWIGRIPGLRYGYEEALGYCVDPDAVKDKDGISAALLILGMVAALKAKGKTLTDILDELARRHGVYETDQVSVRMNDQAALLAVMAQLRAHQPTSIGGLNVISCEDLGLGAQGLPPTDGLRFTLDSGARVIVRPSGTEPKVKCYLQVVIAVDEAGVAVARVHAEERLEALRVTVRQWLG